MRILISAGEASGEMYGGQLIGALRRRLPDAEFFGAGGERMRAAGCEIVVDSKELAVVGITEILPHLRRIYGLFRRLIAEAERRRPDFAVVIDSPAFNLRVAEEMHRRGVPVFYYVAPQFWAWRQWRVKKIRRWIRKALCIFPFEEQWYRERGVDAEFVGHPLADLEPPKITREEFARENGLDADKPWIALLPGSRRKEVRMHLPTLLKAAAMIQAPCIVQKGLWASSNTRGRTSLDQLSIDSLETVELVMALEEAFDIEFAGDEFDLERLRVLPPQDEYEFLLPVASTLDRGWVQRFLAGSKLKVSLVSDARAALCHARAAAVASGTATVEAALMGCPFVMVYRVSALSYLLGRPLVRLPRFAMVNLIAGREVVPELVQSRFTPANVASKLRELISDGPAREK